MNRPNKPLADLLDNQEDNADQYGDQAQIDAWRQRARKATSRRGHRA